MATKLRSMLERSCNGEVSLEARKLAESYSWNNHFSKLNMFLKEIVE
jgi:hypothetical protein